MLLAEYICAPFTNVTFQVHVVIGQFDDTCVVSMPFTELAPFRVNAVLMSAAPLNGPPVVWIIAIGLAVISCAHFQVMLETALRVNDAVLPVPVAGTLPVPVQPVHA